MKEYSKIESVFNRSSLDFKFIPDEWRLSEFRYLKNNLWVATEKVDGMNIRVIWDAEKREVLYKGRTDKAQMPCHLLEKLQKLIFKEKMLKHSPDTSLCIYGEGFGYRIQKGAKYFGEEKLVGLAVFDIRIGDWWQRWSDVKGICYNLGLEPVPLVAEESLVNIVEIVRGSPKSKYGDFVMEGVVAKPSVFMRTRRGERIITKLKCKDFR